MSSEAIPPEVLAAAKVLAQASVLTWEPEEARALPVVLDYLLRGQATEGDSEQD